MTAFECPPPSFPKRGQCLMGEHVSNQASDADGYDGVGEVPMVRSLGRTCARGTGLCVRAVHPPRGRRQWSLDP